MKVRSQSELQDVLDQAIAGRKRELTTLHFLIDQSRREHERNALCRAAVPIVYAHWEGFITTSARAYLAYVSRQSGPLREFSPNIVAVAMRAQMLAAGQAKKTRLHKEFIDSFLSHLDQGIRLAPEAVISGQDNLNSDVLREIMDAVGLDFDSYWETKVTFIDHQLLKTRNEIAHGELSPVDQSAYRQLHELVLEMVETFKTALENAAAVQRFKVARVAAPGGLTLV